MHPSTLNTPPKKVANVHRLRLERQAIALSQACPLEQSNPANCPLSGLRPRSLRDRWTWVRGLSLEELEYLGQYHTGCAAEKLGDPHAS